MACCIVLGIIFGVTLGDFPHLLHKWQTLIAAGVALGAALVAWQNATRTNRQAAALEENRRARKLSSLRAVMPLALSKLTAYAEAAFRITRDLHQRCQGQILPHQTISPPPLPEIPSAEISILAEFIEYADSANTRVLERTISRIQILASRLEGLVFDIEQRGERAIYLRSNVENYMIDAASIYAGTTSYFDYARQRTESPPIKITVDDVRRALSIFGLVGDDPEYETLFQSLDRQREF